MATSLLSLSLSSPTPSTATPHLRLLSSSHFKGNVTTLRATPPPFPSINLCHHKGKLRQPFLVQNSAASLVQEASGSVQTARFRLDNLGPQPGSRKKAKRKGRGHAAGQGGSCGFGMRGQKSRSGPGVRRGFEGGQMPLYRRLPKLRGIAGGMRAGLPKYVPVNLKDIADAGFQEGEEVSLESLKNKGLINPNPSRNPPLIRLHNLILSPMSRFGLCNFPKRVSESKISFRRAAIRCGGSQEMQAADKFDDGYYMRLCVELARKAIGYTSPNPMVGCVIVNNGKIVGQGFHPKAGQPHAEVFALRDAGDLAENGTAYVSLEPCNHYGRTPPCSEALIKARVKNVVVGMVDPNPIVASTGVKKLQDAGIEVTVGVEEELCKRLNEAYIHYMLTRKPYVTLRYSMSLDGHILDQLGEEAVKCGGYYSKLLQEYDAVIVSSTALAETPSLPTSNEPGANQPLKIVLSRCLNPLTKIPALENDAASKLLIVTEKEPQSFEEGIQTLTSEKISLLEILEHCKNQGLCSVLLDLTGKTVEFEDIIKEGFEQNLFQKVVVEVLPFLGGEHERFLNNLDINGKVKKLTSSVSGKTVLLEGYF